MHYGDISEKDRQLMKELEAEEIWFTKQITAMPLDRIAQAYVCFAHDWFDLECEEDGERLLRMAEAVCPGYFLTYLPAHMIENPTFARLIKQLSDKIGNVLERALSGK